MDKALQHLDIRDPEDLQPLFDAPERAWCLDFGQVDVAEHFDVMQGKALPGVRAITMGDCWGFVDRPEALRLLEALPGLSTLEMVWGDFAPAMFSVLASMKLGSLRTLMIGGDIEGTDLLPLTRAAWWSGLESLSLEGVWLERDMVEALLGGPMPGLRDLSVEVKDAAPLFESPVVVGLTELYLTITAPGGFDTVGVQRPVPALPALKRLSLHSAGPVALSRVVAIPMPALNHLSVGQGAALGKPGDFRLGDSGAALIAQTWPGLDVLHLHDAGIGPVGAHVLGEGLRGPRILTLSFNPLGSEGARALVPCLKRTTTLSLHHCGLDAAAMAALAPCLGRLEELHIRGNPIGPRGAAVLAKTPMPSLARLWLSGCQIGARGARALAASQNLEKLTFLDMSLAFSDKDLRGAGARAFYNSPWLPQPLKRQFEGYT